MTNVLIIDDDPIHIEVAQALLEALGMCILATASNGAEAIKIFSTGGRFDLIILDLNMPDFDGVEFLNSLKELEVRPNILIVSAADTAVRTGAKQLAKAYGLNILGGVEKPLTAEKLSNAIKNHNF